MDRPLVDCYRCSNHTHTHTRSGTLRCVQSHHVEEQGALRGKKRLLWSVNSDSSSAEWFALYASSDCAFN